MAMMTGKEYVESLRAMNLRVYMFGKRVENPVDDPILRPSVNSVRMTYDLAQGPNYKALMTATSHLTGETINRFTHIHQSTEDLVNKVKMQRLLGQVTAACFQRCVGMDAINAVYSTTYEIDQKYGTSYHENFRKFVAEAQTKDWTIDGAMTDPKGDRSLPPHKQEDPDMFLHVVERRPDGIVVRGAKAHQTGMCNSHQVLVMPTQAMGPDDKDYAVSFSAPADAEGLFMIVGRQSCDTRKLENTDIDVGINNLLATVNGYFQADRTYVFEIDPDRDVLINTFEYICGQEVSAQMDNLQEVPVSVIEVWMQNFRQGRSYYMSDLEQERGQPSYEMLKAQQVWRLLAVPL